MGIATRIRSLVRQHGPQSVLTKLIGCAIDYVFEWRHGIDTLAIRDQASLTVPNGSQHLGHDYEASRAMPLRRLIPEMQRMVDPDSALVDCGSGKGKVLFIAAECGVREIRGIEFASELCDIANTNWIKVKRSLPFEGTLEIICSDISRYEIRSNDSMFFLFNPFHPTVLEKLLADIVASFTRYPRDIAIAIAFMSEAYAETVARFPEFTEPKISVYWACRFTILSLHKSN